jgi:hypothetical protein
VSASVADAFGKSPGGGPEASDPVSSVGRRDAKPAVDAASSTFESFLIVAAKLELSERAIATPISS